MILLYTQNQYFILFVCLFQMNFKKGGVMKVIYSFLKMSTLQLIGKLIFTVIIYELLKLFFRVEDSLIKMIVLYLTIFFIIILFNIKLSTFYPKSRKVKIIKQKQSKIIPSSIIKPIRIKDDFDIDKELKKYKDLNMEREDIIRSLLSRDLDIIDARLQVKNSILIRDGCINNPGSLEHIKAIDGLIEAVNRLKYTEERKRNRILMGLQ